jgi:hypothetical protein
MLEDTTRIFCERLARAVDRRTFLKRVGETAFVGMAALAAGAMLPAGASADHGVDPGPNPIVPRVPTCSPPGPYCNLNGVNEPNACHGASCFQHRYNGQVLQCRAFYGGYITGCWTTPVSGGYWVCCDCECGTPTATTCGCAQFSGAPVPRPDAPRA